MKKTIISIFYLFSAMMSVAQQIAPDFDNVGLSSPSSFVLGQYLISPEHKTVGVYAIGGKGPIGMAAGYFTDKSINYNSTSLIILGDELIFKEKFPPGCDFETLEFIEKYTNRVIYKDKNYIYYYTENYPLTYENASGKIDISNYKSINKYIYQDTSNNLYFLSFYTSYGGKLEKITDLPDLDIATLKHLTGHYYTDKNGLYLLGTNQLSTHNDYSGYTATLKSIKMQDSEGKNIVPTLTKNYFIYNKQVYANTRYVDKLKLDADKMMEVEWSEYSNIYFITDGKNLYENRNSGYSADYWNKDNDYANDFFKSGINLQKIYPPQIKFIQKENDKNLYFAGGRFEKPVHITEKYGILVKTDNGHYFANTGLHSNKPQKIEKIIIYNVDTKQDEAFDETQFYFIAEDMYAYKKHWFFHNIPIKEALNTTNLKFISKDDTKSNFITDGKALVYIGNITGYSSDYNDGTEKVVFEKRIKTGIDISKLKMITKDILMDENNFYNGTYSGIQIIPINKLGFPVKVL